MSLAMHRILVVVFLSTWVLGVSYSLIDPNYVASKEVSAQPTIYYHVLSLGGVIFLFASGVIAFWRNRIARYAFSAYLMYATTYTALYGAGSGGAIGQVLDMVHFLSAGAILASLLSPMGKPSKPG